MPVHGLDNAVISRKERCGSKGVGEHIDALGLHRLQAALTNRGEAFAARHLRRCHLFE